MKQIRVRKLIIKEKYITTIIFTLLGLLGIWLYQDYGISWDERISTFNGLVSLKYVAEIFHCPKLIGGFATIIPELATWQDRFYGVAFELPVMALSNLFKITDFQTVFYFRHLLTFLVFLAGGYSLYRLAILRFKSYLFGFIAIALYFLSPRQFAEGFYNDKDIVFMAVYSIAIYKSIQFILKPTIKTALTAALFTALSIDVRITGVFLPLIISLIYFIQILKSRLDFKKTNFLILYAALTLILVVVFWPYLWTDPISRFVESFQVMSKYPWPGAVFFSGQLISASDLPWYYALVWMGITIPVYYLILFLIGVFTIVLIGFKTQFQIWKNNEQLIDIASLALFAGPLLAVIAMKSVLYDGWRQLYFVYPTFLMIALCGFNFLLSTTINSNFLKDKLKPKTKNQIVTMILTLPLIPILIWMIQAHPYQNVYFNFLAGSERYSKWEIDYWGLSNREALEYILDNHPQQKQSTITIKAISVTPLDVSLLILKESQRQRIQLVEDNADYLINNFRGITNSSLQPPVGYRNFHQIIIDKEPILLIFQKESIN